MSSKEDNDDAKGSKSSQTTEKYYLEKFLSPLTTPTDSTDCFKLSSPLLKLKDISSLWEGIVPANRSSLSLDKHNQSLNLKSSSEHLFNRPKLLVPGKRSIIYNTHVTDLTCDSSIDEGTGPSSITPCTLKMPKLEPCLTQDVGNSKSSLEFISSSTSCSNKKKRFCFSDSGEREAE